MRRFVPKQGNESAWGVSASAEIAAKCLGCDLKQRTNCGFFVSAAINKRFVKSAEVVMPAELLAMKFHDDPATCYSARAIIQGPECLCL